MPYVPSENLEVSWPTRNAMWRHYPVADRRRTAGIPRRLCGVTVDDPRLVNKPGKTVKAWARNWPQRTKSGVWDDEGREQGLLLLGEPGRGKTTHALAAANCVSDLGWATKYITVANWHEMALAVVRLSKSGSDETDDWADALSAYETWLGWPLLVLDDLGKEHATASAYARDNLDRLIRSRFDTGAPTVITSNLTTEEIGERYGPSMGSFIREAFTIAKYSDLPDYR